MVMMAFSLKVKYHFIIIIIYIGEMLLSKLFEMSQVLVNSVISECIRKDNYRKSKLHEYTSTVLQLSHFLAKEALTLSTQMKYWVTGIYSKEHHFTWQELS